MSLEGSDGRLISNPMLSELILVFMDISFENVNELWMFGVIAIRLHILLCECQNTQV